ncbi:ABC transporter ATP-binding protein [Fusibacter sp. JL298sf-3]
MAILKAEGVSFYYQKEKPILDNIQFQVKSGEVVGITAPSGRGKTTLGKILAGYEKPSRGQVILEGVNVPKGEFYPVQLIYQHPEKAVNPKWKMEKMLKESGEPYEDLLEPLGIESAWLKRWPSELSGGELQRFCVLRALTPKTKFLIADEMTTMLDAITQAQIWHVVLAFAKAHDMGLIVISHDDALLEKLCDRIVKL